MIVTAKFRYFDQNEDYHMRVSGQTAYNSVCKLKKIIEPLMLFASLPV